MWAHRRFRCDVTKHVFQLPWKLTNRSSPFFTAHSCCHWRRISVRDASTSVYMNRCYRHDWRCCDLTFLVSNNDLQGYLCLLVRSIWEKVSGVPEDPISERNPLRDIVWAPHLTSRTKCPRYRFCVSWPLKIWRSQILTSSWLKDCHVQIDLGKIPKSIINFTIYKFSLRNLFIIVIHSDRLNVSKSINPNRNLNLLISQQEGISKCTHFLYQ